MQTLKACGGDMRIDLCGGQITVSKQQLHTAQIGAMIHQMCGEGVSERVR